MDSGEDERSFMRSLHRCLGAPLSPDGVMFLALEGCREVGGTGGGVGDASPGRTQLRLFLGKAISAAMAISALKSSSLIDDVVHPELESRSAPAPSSSAPRVERVIARGKFGAKADRTLALSLRESRPCGSSEED